MVINTHLSDDATVPAGTGNYPPSDAESTQAAKNYSSTMSTQKDYTEIYTAIFEVIQPIPVVHAGLAIWLLLK